MLLIQQLINWLAYQAAGSLLDSHLDISWSEPSSALAISCFVWTWGGGAAAFSFNKQYSAYDTMARPDRVKKELINWKKNATNGDFLAIFEDRY